MPDARVDRTNTERMVCNSQVRTETDTETDTETTATDNKSTHSTIKQNETFSDMCWFCIPEQTVPLTAAPRSSRAPHPGTAGGR